MNSSFLTALGRLDGGNLVENADELLQNVVRDVTRYGGKGSVTLTITVAPNGDPNARGIKIGGKVKSTAPSRPQGESFYWADEDGSLRREPPKDHDLFEGPRAVVTDPSTPRY